jgi:excisionase family DNA binding protein
MKNAMDPPEVMPCKELPVSSSDAVVKALTDIAGAVRELAADRGEQDPLRLLRAEEVAQLLRLPLRTVHERAAAGVIPHRRFGKHYRFSRADVEEIIRQMARTARPRGSFRAA